jgi:hypothetical protein
MRIILKGYLTVSFSQLLSTSIEITNTSEGAIIGDEGVVLVTDEDVQKVLDVLRLLGFSAEAGEMPCHGTYSVAF